MSYDFANLSHSDFENLALDLVSRALGVRFEAFTEGRDGGIDGRYAAADGSVILQAKHYHRSGFKALKSKMIKERQAIDRLQPKRYILVTSASLTPPNKDVLSEIIGPTLQTSADILGPDDLNGLLRSHPDIEKSHQKLWTGSTPVLEAVVTAAVKMALEKPSEPPAALMKLVSKAPDNTAASSETPPARDIIFLIKSFPIDDEFTLWLAPKLEAEGYHVFSDILTLQPGDRWRREVNMALQLRAAKVLVVCRDATLSDPNVQDDLDIALDVSKELKDKRFIIPLRLEVGKKVKGITDSVPVDFVRSWGDGLQSLLIALQRQKVPRRVDQAQINVNWEIYRRRGSIPLVDEPERLTSNWLRVVEAPDSIRYFETTGLVERSALENAVAAFPFPAIIQGAGFISFADQADVDASFAALGRFRLKHEIPLLDFVEKGFTKLGIERQVASNFIVLILKEAWYSLCRSKGFIEYQYANASGFHASPQQAATGQRIPWGKQGERRSSMLRNSAKGHIWQFGVTAIPSFWPFWHFKLKSRVLFAGDNGTAAGLKIDDSKKLHRLRRTICKGWRNKVWHGRMLAFLELFSGDSAYVRLAVSGTQAVVIEASPVLFTSPVSTTLPNLLDPDEEESDHSTLGRPENDETESEG